MTSAKQKYPTIRISAETHKTVKEMAEQDQTSMAEVVAEAVKQYERARFWEHANAVWAEAMQDPETRAHWKREDEEIERTFWTPIKEPWDWDGEDLDEAEEKDA